MNNEEINEWQLIAETKWNRKYARRYLKEQREKWNKENPERTLLGDGLLYPGSDEIFKDYYELKDLLTRIAKILNYDLKEDEKFVFQRDAREILEMIEDNNGDIK